MRIYLGSWYGRQEEMRKYRNVLVRMGHTVTSQWLDQPGGPIDNKEIDSDLRRAAVHGLKDIGDLISAEVLILFTEPHGKGRGGHHTELGYALASGMEVIAIGRRENVFQALPYVRHYPSWEAFLQKDGLRHLANYRAREGA